MSIIGIVFLELAALILIVFGFIHEEKLIQFEDQIIKKIFRK